VTAPPDFHEALIAHIAASFFRTLGQAAVHADALFL
jgi:hypothetical protein